MYRQGASVYVWALNLPLGISVPSILPDSATSPVSSAGNQGFTSEPVEEEQPDSGKKLSLWQLSGLQGCMGMGGPF